IRGFQIKGSAFLFQYLQELCTGLFEISENIGVSFCFLQFPATESVLHYDISAARHILDRNKLHFRKIENSRQISFRHEMISSVLINAFFYKNRKRVLRRPIYHRKCSKRAFKSRDELSYFLHPHNTSVRLANTIANVYPSPFQLRKIES